MRLGPTYLRIHLAAEGSWHGGVLTIRYRFW